MPDPTAPAPLADTAPGDGPPPPTGGRVASIDAYRGFVMLLMMAEVLRLGKVAKAFPDSGFWTLLARQQTHVAWEGCTLHDLIQPSFSFLVGVALPFSLARRAAGGQPEWVRTLHAFWRALVLVLLGVFLRSTHAPQTNWTFEDTLTQIGLGYGFLYLMAMRSVRVQVAALTVILVGYWLLFAADPLPGPDFDWPAAGADPNSLDRPAGFAAHWGLNTNPAWRFDGWFLNLFPRPKAFAFNRGGYSTLSFVPTLGTMVLGLLAGRLLRADLPPLGRVCRLTVAGVGCLAAGWLLGAVGVCPIVKRIWTPSWVLFSGGWCLLLLAGFYLVMDVGGWRRWAFALTVVGANSLAAYLIAHLVDGFIGDALDRHLGKGWAAVAGEGYTPLVHGAAVLIVEWLILLWLYRRNLFVRV